MKRNITLIICLLCFGQVLMAQELLKEFKDNNNLYGLKDKNGNVVVEPKYTEISYFSNDIMKIEMKIESGYKKGLIDGRTGKEIIPPKYNFINSPELGMLMGKMEISLGESDKYGVINNTGREIIPAIYDDIKLTKGGFAIVTIHKIGEASKMGVIDAEGREIIPAIYNPIRPMENNKGFRVRLNGMEGFFNIQGKEIIPANKYDLIDEMDKDGFMQVRKGKKFGVVNEQGKEIAKCIYDYIAGYFENGYFKDGYTRTNIGKKYGFIDTLGNEVPCKYSDIDLKVIKYGFAIVKYKGKYGTIDNKGREIVPFNFDYLSFSDSSWLKEKNKSGKSAFDYANLISPETGKALAYAYEKAEEIYGQEKDKRDAAAAAREKDKINIGFNFLFKYQCNAGSRFSFLTGKKVSVSGGTMTLTNTYNGETQSSVLRLRIASTRESTSNGVKYWTYNFYENENNYKSAIVEFNTGNYSKEMYSITLVSDDKDPIYCNDTNAAAGLK